ncbi:MAG: roadblock/LC7 domain-containing protein [ANME-2 cluster archaeon]|nr:roadblock/LC7 domain-containing protein [ANME-2 cluster archaeon]
MSKSINMDILFKKVQKDLSNLKGVKKSLVASQDGYIFSNTAESMLEMYAKASAALLRTADTATAKVGRNCSKRVVIDYPNERLIAIRAGPKALVAVIARTGTGLDPLIIELDKAADKVREII